MGSACCLAAGSQTAAFTATPTMGNLRATTAPEAESSRRLNSAVVEQGQTTEQASSWCQAAPLMALGAVATTSAMGLARNKKTKKNNMSGSPTIVPIQQS